MIEATRLTLGHRDPLVRRAGRYAAVMMLLTASLQTVKFGLQPRWRWQPVARESTLEYKLGNWLKQRNPEGRIFATGGLRFRLNAWFDLPQVGGGFESGLRNRMPIDLMYRIRTAATLQRDRREHDTVLMLKTLGVQYVVVHGSNSKEYYRDFVDPERLRDLQLVYHANDDYIYEMAAPPLAHLVSREEMPLGDAPNRPWVLEPYVRAMEDPSRPAVRTRWLDPRSLTLEGAVPEGRMMALKVNWEEGWRAAQNGRPVEIERDNLGFMVVHAVPSPAARVELRYEGTREQRVAAVVCVLAWLAAFSGLYFDFRRRRVS